MEKTSFIIPFMTFFANLAILLNVPVFREIVVFAFLSFIPGFAILRLFKLKETRFLDTVLFSVGLSIAFVMFIGFLVNELYVVLGYSQPLSTVPLTVAISAFTLAVFVVQYRRDSSENLELKTGFEGELKNILPLSILLFLLPLLSAIGVLYLNVSLILLSCVIIAAFCIMSAVSKRLIPEKIFPLLLFSISLALLCQVILTSRYILGYDANLEYYVFRLTQMNGQWGFLNANVNSYVTLSYNSMLSLTLLPAVYSALMNAQGGIVFKILYPLLFCFVPLIVYRICEKQFGKMIGLFSGLFFVFTNVAFYGEPVGLNRQIVGELFLVLSVFILIEKAIPLTKRRWLLIIFGAALIVSHYTLAYIYLAIIALVFIISRVKPRFDNTLDGATVLVLFLIAIAWYTVGSYSLLSSLAFTIKLVLVELTSGIVPTQGTASAVIFIPQVYTVATWINLLLSGIAYLFLIIGVLAIVLRPKKTGIFPQYILMIIIGAILLVASYVSPSIAATLNFTRFYGITLLFLAPCFVLGGQALLATIGKAWTKIKRPLKRQIASKRKNVDIALLLIAIILGAYFLSQVGFVNTATNSAIHTYNTSFYSMLTSSDIQVKINLYGTYIPQQDVFSASWLQSYNNQTTEVYADPIPETNVLLSYGLIPNELLLPITNTTILPQGSFVYLDSLNVVNGVITTSNGTISTSQISPLLNQNDLLYSNGNSEVWYAVPVD